MGAPSSGRGLRAKGPGLGPGSENPHDQAMKPSMPTNAELAILRVLWREGPQTVREAHQAIYRDTDVGYTSALKLMQNMLAKGLVTRQDEGRHHVYAAAAPEQATLNRLVSSWMDTAF